MNHLVIAETILRNREAFFEEIRDSKQIPQKIISMLISCLVFLGVYGAVMGASHSFLQALSSMVKLPFLFLVTLAISAPSLHVFYILFGARQSMSQMIALILSTLSTSSILLFSLAPITFFFLVTGSGYYFFYFLNFLFFAFAGFLGTRFMRQGIQIVTAKDNIEDAGKRQRIFIVWVLLYGFVGAQMTTTLSPFLGHHGDPFVFMYPGGRNFFIDLLNSFGRLLTF
jgi:hypothetical protein